MEFPCYGRPRITAELKRRGWEVSHKRVWRIMREDNLLCLPKKKFVVTTNSDHGLRVYPNLASGMEGNRINQLWVAGITCIRLESEFVYLTVALDACSRRGAPSGPGWALEDRREDELTIGALRMALRLRKPAPGLVHHSDRGVQYAWGDYIKLLKENQIQVSMSRQASPWDNAACESFMKTLKYEEVYNQRRIHSALGYVPPAEFEREGWSAGEPARARGS